MSDFKVFAYGRFEWEQVFRRIVVPQRIRATKGIGMMLASFANADGTKIFIGEEGVAGLCQVGKSTVNPCMKWMRDQYLIYRVSHGVTVKGRRLADEYRLCCPSDWETRFTLLPANGRDMDLVLPKPRRANPKPLGSRFDVDTDRQTSNQRLDARR